MTPEWNATHPSFPHCLEYFRASESKKINHMRSNRRHKITFQDVVYSKSNKWRVKIFKNIDKKTSIWCVKLIRKQEIILFLYRATKCPTKAEKIEYAQMSWLFTSEDKTKPNTTEFPFLYYLGWYYFEKTTEKKSEELIKKSIWKQEIK